MVRELLLPLHMKPTAKRFLRFFVTILLPTISNRWAFALIIRVILCCMYNMLHYIAGSSMRGSKEATELVMEFGTPDVSAVNNEGLTALDIAAKKNDETLVKFLLKYS